MYWMKCIKSATKAICAQTLILVSLLASYLGLVLIVQLLDMSVDYSISTVKVTQQAFDREKDSGRDDRWVGVPFNDTTGLFWFVHVTDIHISKWETSRDGHRTRAEDLQDFCKFMNGVIKPKVTVVGGDLTDSTGKSNHFMSDQYEEEWATYQTVTGECQASSDNWLDIRGNHDDMNVESYEAPNSYYTTYGVQGKTKGSYLKKFQEEDGRKFAIVMIDATLQPGPKKMLDLFGSIKEPDLNLTRQLMSEADDYNDSGLVTVGHYPLNFIASTGSESLESVLGTYRTLAYLSGHLHNAYIWRGGPGRMYTKRSEGVMELELGDWKKNRLFRLLAIDRGRLSFIDHQYKPGQTDDNRNLVLITNPLDAQFIFSPDIRGSFQMMKESTHIRHIHLFVVKNHTLKDPHPAFLYKSPFFSQFCLPF